MYLPTIEFGEVALELYRLPDTLAPWDVLEGAAGVVSCAGGAVDTEDDLDGRTGATGSGAGVEVTVDCLLMVGTGAATGAATVGAGVGTTGVSGTAVAVGVVVLSVAVVVSLALFSCLILSISSSLLDPVFGLGAGWAGLATGLGAGGGVSFFFGLINSISLSLSL